MLGGTCIGLCLSYGYSNFTPFHGVVFYFCFQSVSSISLHTYLNVFLIMFSQSLPGFYTRNCWTYYTSGKLLYLAITFHANGWPGTYLILPMWYTDRYFHVSQAGRIGTNSSDLTTVWGEVVTQWWTLAWHAESHRSNPWHFQLNDQIVGDVKNWDFEELLQSE